MVNAERLGPPRPTISLRLFSEAFAPDGSSLVSAGYGNSRVLHHLAEALGWVNGGRLEQDHATSICFMGFRSALLEIYIADREKVRIELFDSEGRYLRDPAEIDRCYALCLQRETFGWKAACKRHVVLPWVGF